MPERNWKVSINIGLNDRASRGLRALGNEVKGLSKGMNASLGSVGAALDGIGAVATAIAPELGIPFMAIGTGVKAALSGLTTLGRIAASVLSAVGNAVSRVTSKLWDMTKTIGIVGAALTVEFGRRAIGAAMEMEGYWARMRVAMKDTAEAAKMLRWAMDFSQQTPFEMSEVVDAAVRLQNYGLDARRWIPLLGDMAGAMQRSLTQAVEAAADLFSGGGLERIKEFGINSQKLIQFGAAANGPGALDYSSAEAIERNKAALEALIKTQFGGGMASMMQTATGAVSNFKDALWTFFVDVGNRAMPAFRGLLSYGQQLLTWLRESGMAAQLGQALGNALTWMTQMIAHGVNWLVTKALTPGNLKKARDWFVAVVATVKGMAVTFWDYLTRRIPQWVDWLVAKWDEFSARVILNWNSVVASVGQAVTGIINTVSKLGEVIITLAETFEGVGRAMVGSLAIAWAPLLEVVQALVAAYGKISEWRGNKEAAQWAKDMYDSLQGVQDWLQDMARRTPIAAAMGMRRPEDSEWLKKYDTARSYWRGAAASVEETVHKLQIDISDSRTLEAMLRSPIARQILREEIRAYVARTGGQAYY